MSRMIRRDRSVVEPPGAHGRANGQAHSRGRSWHDGRARNPARSSSASWGSSQAPASPSGGSSRTSGRSREYCTCTDNTRLDKPLFNTKCETDLRNLPDLEHLRGNEAKKGD